MQHAYLFETRGIQRFLFASGKLRDMLGGSELLDYICAEDGLLEHTLEKLDLAPATVRKAGAAFYLLFTSKKDAARLQAAWRLACASWLPGVEQIDALSSGASAREAIDQGLNHLRRARNQLQPELPRPGPLTERSPRTGRAAVKTFKSESLDAATARQRTFKRPQDGRQLAQRFLADESYIWPDNFEENSPAEQRFPLGERKLVGLLHADGNGLGELLRVINNACQQADDATYIKLYRAFSEGISQATQTAVQEASLAVLVPAAFGQVLPARPLVLGGDDLSMLLRADLALPFAKAYLAAFERHSQEAMSTLKQMFAAANLTAEAADIPQYLTACAGICYMKSSQPFQAGYALAEGLCGRAKAQARKVRQEDQPIPATVAMHKVLDSILDDAESQFEQNNCASHGDQTWALALPAYSLQPLAGMPCLNDLERLLDVFANGKLNDRPLRELVTLLYSNLGEARAAYIRWRELAKRHQPKELDAFDQALHALIGEPMHDLPFSRDAQPQTPLADFLALRGMQAAPHQPQESK
jgi:hypothetical protein